MKVFCMKSSQLFFIFIFVIGGISPRLYAMGGRPYPITEQEQNEIRKNKNLFQFDCEVQRTAYLNGVLYDTQSLVRAAWACQRFDALSKMYPLADALAILEAKIADVEYLQDPEYLLSVLKKK